MEKKVIFGVLLKNNFNGEQKFDNLNQLTHAGKRLVFLVIALTV